jgi:hypothetical protein
LLYARLQKSLFIFQYLSSTFYYFASPELKEDSNLY